METGLFDISSHGRTRMDDQYGRDDKVREVRQELFKHSAAIHIENNITFLQRRTWNALLFHAYNELESEEEHRIPMKRLAELVGYDSHDMDYLKETSKE